MCNWHSQTFLEKQRSRHSGVTPYITRFFERGHHPLCPGQATSGSHKNTAISFSRPELSRQGLCSACLSTAVETCAPVLRCFSSLLWVSGTSGRGVTFLTQQWTMMKSCTSRSISCLATRLHSLSKRLSSAVCPGWGPWLLCSSTLSVTWANQWDAHLSIWESYG